jgi:hypothetical protein
MRDANFNNHPLQILLTQEITILNFIDLRSNAAREHLHSTFFPSRLCPHGEIPAVDSSGVLLEMEAEFLSYKNIPIRPVSNRSRSHSYETYKLMLNTMGGES